MRLEKRNTENFERLCRKFRDVRIELTKEGVAVIKPGMTGKNGILNFQITGQLGAWNEKYQLGAGFNSKTLFALPNGAKRSPDLSWIKIERWNALTREQQEKFPPLCPDFVVELRSKSDALKPLQAKMAEYIENGAQLGWLIDPIKRKVHIYRPNNEVEILNEPTEVSGGPLLPKFVLKLKDFWE